MEVLLAYVALSFMGMVALVFSVIGILLWRECCSFLAACFILVGVVYTIGIVVVLV